MLEKSVAVTKLLYLNHFPKTRFSSILDFSGPFNNFVTLITNFSSFKNKIFYIEFNHISFIEIIKEAKDPVTNIFPF